ncbi:MAG: hypothetical protein V4700_03210 [Pseudomonadota bacterium]
METDQRTEASILLNFIAVFTLAGFTREESKKIKNEITAFRSFPFPDRWDSLPQEYKIYYWDYDNWIKDRKERDEPTLKIKKDDLEFSRIQSLVNTLPANSETSQQSTTVLPPQIPKLKKEENNKPLISSQFFSNTPTPSFKPYEETSEILLPENHPFAVEKEKKNSKVVKKEALSHRGCVRIRLTAQELAEILEKKKNNENISILGKKK